MKDCSGSWSRSGLRQIFLTSGAVCFLNLLAADVCSAAPLGLVAWWKGEGNASDSAGTNNAAVVSGIRYADGRVGQAFRFDSGNSLITVPRSPSLTTSDLTITAWIFPTDATAPRPIVDCGGPGQASSIQLWVHTTGGFSVNPGALHAVIRDERGGYEVDDPDPVAPVNQWSYVAFTADAKTRTLRLYCNGILVATAAAPNPLHQDLFSNVNIGYRDAASSELLAGLHYRGALDEIKIYNCVLDDEQIRLEYDASRIDKTGSRGNPVASGTRQTVPDIDSSLIAINPNPALSISNSGTSIFLSWPISAAGYKLQGADTLMPLVVWSNLAVTLETNGDRIMATLPASKPSQFFRLSQW